MIEPFPANIVTLELTPANIMYVASAGLQIVSLVYDIKMLLEVKDRRPWIVLFIALSIMFALRCMALAYGPEKLAAVSPAASFILSFLFLLVLLYLRQVAIAERDSENRYRSLVELSPDAIFVNADNKIAYLNPAAVRFFGAGSAEQLLGRSALDFLSPEYLTAARARIADLGANAGAIPVVEQIWSRIDGSTVTVESVSASIPWQRARAIQVVLRDISERKRAEGEKSRLLASERVARSNAEHANRMKDEFLATLSHELRTPLNAILGWSQLLRAGSSDKEEVNQGLDTIERNARAQTQLIEDLLDMSRIISGKLRLDIQRVVPTVFINNAIETVRPAADAKEIRIEQILDPSAGPISGDPNRLQQVAWNLLSNAVKFTPRGGKVQVLLRRVNSHIEITVTDTGLGISPEFIPFLFERFRQADASTTRRHGGLGLGLSIAKQLIDLHGGSIDAQSKGENQGSVFTVRLPLVAVQYNESSGVHPAAHGSFDAVNSTDLSGLRVLVVDDELDARELLKHVLAGSKASVTTAGSAAEAMLLLNDADVLISDIGMPEMDGYEFLRRVRALGPNGAGSIPAIALTAFARSEDRTRALMAGYQVHISKPVSKSELIASVASVTGRTGATSSR